MKKGTLAVISTIVGAIAGAVGSSYRGTKKIEQKSIKVDKFKAYYNVLNQWLILKQEGKNLSDYFVRNGYHTIAIYGMGEMGNRLYDELKNSEIKVKYAIDKNASNIYAELDIYDMSEELETVDAIVVSAIFTFDEVKESLSEKTASPIISLEDVVYDV